MAYVVQLDDVSKVYGRAKVLDTVNITLQRGECLALLGENGAGKSTLAKIMGGVVGPSSGRVIVRGVPQTFRSPHDSLSMGLAVIPQELAGVPKLTVAENLVLGHWPTRGGFTSRGLIVSRAREALRKLDLTCDLHAIMDQLPLAERQLIEIAKVLSFNAEVIVLDEPTATLSAVEADKLLTILKGLKTEGRTLVYVSHRLDESFRLADRIAVLRNGRLVLTTPTRDTTPDDVIATMLGNVAHVFERSKGNAAVPSTDGPPIVEVRNWRVSGMPGLNNISFKIEAGEIVGVFGLVGSGAELIARGMAGLVPGLQGELNIEGVDQPLFHNPRQARLAGVSYVPAERKVDGLAISQTIKANLLMLSLDSLSSFGFMRGREEYEQAQRLAREYDVRCQSIGQAAGELSGGNQQKVLMASRLGVGPKILVLHEPTRGVDVGARAQIHQMLSDIANRGTAVLMVSSDSMEAVNVSDRLLVVRGGRIASELRGVNKTEDRAITLATRSVD